METDDTKQQEIVYITNLEDGLQKDGTKLYNEEGPNEKNSLNNLNHVIEVYKESGSDVDYIEDSLKRTKRT